MLEDVQLEPLVVDTLPVETSFSVNFLLASNRAAATSITMSTSDIFSDFHISLSQLAEHKLVSLVLIFSPKMET